MQAGELPWRLMSAVAMERAWGHEAVEMSWDGEHLTHPTGWVGRPFLSRPGAVPVCGVEQAVLAPTLGRT